MEKPGKVLRDMWWASRDLFITLNNLGIVCRDTWPDKWELFQYSNDRNLKR